mgnify:CR=1 FL=1|tara:strand:+ start:3098 stop:4441 length:1344 start_codon:yes stop_codon:yes gene_type:complete
MAPKKNTPKTEATKAAPKVAKAPAAAKVAKAPAAAKVAKAPAAAKVVKEVASDLSTPLPIGPDGLDQTYISHARVKTLMVSGHLNAGVIAASKDLKAIIDENKHAVKTLESGKTTDTREVEKTVDGVAKKSKEEFERDITAAERKALTAIVTKHSKKIADIERDYAAFHSLSLRMGGQTHDAVASVCDSVMTEILRKVVDYTTSLQKKSITVDHIYKSDLTTLSLYPLIATLPTVMEGVNAEQSRVRHAATEAAVHAALKAAKVPKQAADAVEDALEADEVAEPAADESSKHPFGYYIQNLAKDISKLQHPGVGTRPYRVTFEHLSDIASELIARICNQILISVSDAKSKTIGTRMVMSAVKRILTDGHAPHETVELRKIMVADPTALDAEEAKKAAAKAKGTKYVIDESKLPQVEDKEAVYTVTYPTSPYEALAARVDAYLTAVAK